MTIGIEVKRKPDPSSNMKLGRLGDHVEILSGFAFDSSRFATDGEMPLIRIRDVVRGRTETYYSGPFEERFVVRKGDLLVGMDGDFNRETWSSEPAVLNQRVCRISPVDAHLDRRYLYHFLPQALMEIWHATPFATVKHLSVKAIREIALPLPPVEEQRRVAAVLDKVDELRTKRLQALAHADALTQSLFHATVEAKEALLPAMTLADLGLSFSSGKNLISSGGDAHAHNRVIKVNAVSGGVFQPSESKPLPRTYIPNEQHRIRTGDLLFTRASGSLDLIGISVRVGAVGDHLFLPDKIWRAEFAPGAKICPEYLQSLFKTPAFRAFVNNAASGAAGVKNISQRSVLGFVVSAPGLTAQEEFAKQVTAVELLKERHRSQLAELDALFASLRNRAFNGEL
ncbi:restriction endonuclease subunit S [Arthrobacter sp. MI7-26]|uniref:restriction endonuclease subunit S n=1 Tax=Arthrobacter sp. MI7-26 TaxID=2993653 RepID=UPI002248BF5B|nr:restriction endonuclease subunit S [Arthrobacter sp. MI7-26]MCX2749935.1 restriction endonuclease subunit S [Arthrobacter sp. MI7-26]